MLVLPKRTEWLRKKTTDQLIIYREMTMRDMASLGDCHRAGLYMIMEDQLKAVEKILKERG